MRKISWIKSVLFIAVLSAVLVLGGCAEETSENEASGTEEGTEALVAEGRS